MENASLSLPIHQNDESTLGFCAHLYIFMSVCLSTYLYIYLECLPVPSISLIPLSFQTWRKCSPTQQTLGTHKLLIHLSLAQFCSPRILNKPAHSSVIFLMSISCSRIQNPKGQRRVVLINRVLEHLQFLTFSLPGYRC